MTRATKTTLGSGVYTIGDVARYTVTNPSTVRSWFTSSADNTPLLRGDYSEFDGIMSVSFYDLVDALVALSLKKHGFSMQRVRRIYRYLQDDLSHSHPFCVRKLYVGGKDVFYEAVADAGEDANLRRTFDKQDYFGIVRECLESIDYRDSLAASWNIATDVVVNPKVAFGMPVVTGTGTRTSVIAAAYFSNDEDSKFVSKLYEIPERKIRHAVDFSVRYQEISQAA